MLFQQTACHNALANIAGQGINNEQQINNQLLFQGDAILLNYNQSMNI
jgi:hypothetical protein